MPTDHSFVAQSKRPVGLKPQNLGTRSVLLSALLILHCESKRIGAQGRGWSLHKDICESMGLFANEVMPELAERAPEREARKRKRYAETTERLQNFHDLDLTPEVTTMSQAAAA